MNFDEALRRTKRGCKELQDAEGEFCPKHYPVLTWKVTGNKSMGFSVIWGYGGALRNFIGGSKTPRSYTTRERARKAGGRAFGMNRERNK